jgi:hypothetical protein
MKFSTRQLLIFTTGAAIACASLAFPSPVIGDAYYTVGLLTIVFSTIAAIYNRGSARAFWVGFVICFAGYFCHTVWPSELRSTFLSLRRMGQLDYPAPDIITTRGLSIFFQGTNDGAAAMRLPTGSASQMMARNTVGQYLAFMTIGHTAFAFILGIIGGAFAQRVVARTNAASTDPLPTSTS